jgi:hypothetical protein
VLLPPRSGGHAVLEGRRARLRRLTRHDTGRRNIVPRERNASGA